MTAGAASGRRQHSDQAAPATRAKGHGWLRVPASAALDRGHAGAGAGRGVTRACLPRTHRTRLRRSSGLQGLAALPDPYRPMAGRSPPFAPAPCSACTRRQVPPAPGALPRRDPPRGRARLRRRPRSGSAGASATTADRAGRDRSGRPERLSASLRGRRAFRPRSPRARRARSRRSAGSARPAGGCRRCARGRRPLPPR